MQKQKTILSTQLFFLYLGDLWVTGKWSMHVDENKCILLQRQGSKKIFSPLTAVYHHLTGKEIDRGSFWVDEYDDEFDFPWWERLELSYAWMACTCAGREYDKKLRQVMLDILKKPEVVKLLPSVSLAA